MEKKGRAFRNTCLSRLIEEIFYVQRSYKSNKNRKSCHWRRQPGSDPVHVQHEDGRMWRQRSEQIHRLEDAGCDIIRVAVPTMEAAAAIREIKKQIHIPLVADIHFDYRLAIAAIESGADKIRINGQHRGERAGEGCRR